MVPSPLISNANSRIGYSPPMQLSRPKALNRPTVTSTNLESVNFKAGDLNYDSKMILTFKKNGKNNPVNQSKDLKIPVISNFGTFNTVVTKSVEKKENDLSKKGKNSMSNRYFETDRYNKDRLIDNNKTMQSYS